VIVYGAECLMIFPGKAEELYHFEYMYCVVQFHHIVGCCMLGIVTIHKSSLEKMSYV